VTSPASGDDLPEYAPIPGPRGPALDDQGYNVGRVERNLYWVTDGFYQSLLLTTRDGVGRFDAPPTIGNNLRRAADEIADVAVRGHAEAAIRKDLLCLKRL
jgi:hypothetical protein